MGYAFGHAWSFSKNDRSELGGLLDTSKGQPTGLENGSSEMVVSGEELFGETETFFQKLFTSFFSGRESMSTPSFLLLTQAQLACSGF